jgi:hypothetical protein
MLEYRHDWAAFNFTPELFKYVFTEFIPDVIMHTRDQDQRQIQDNYDRMFCVSLYSLPLRSRVNSTDIFLLGYRR